MAARGEGALEARQVADQERMQLQQENQERLHHMQGQEQQVCQNLPSKAFGDASITAKQDKTLWRLCKHDKLADGELMGSCSSKAKHHFV